MNIPTETGTPSAWTTRSTTERDSGMKGAAV
jgi:hypothetical protein